MSKRVEEGAKTIEAATVATFALNSHTLIGFGRCCLVSILLCAAAFGQQLVSQSTPHAGPESSAESLARAQKVMGLARVGDSIIHYRAVAAVEQNYQSDRTYPPFFSAMQVQDAWFDPRSGVERVSTQTTYPGGGPPAQVSFTDANGAFVLANDQLQTLPSASMESRYLSPWAVISDWVGAGDVRIAGREHYRDYERIVLARTTADGEIRLFIDPKTGFPVKLELEEKHYLWGQRHIEYVYTNWTQSGALILPGASFMLADGKTEISETVGEVEIIAHGARPPFSLPAEPAESPDALPPFLQPVEPKVLPVGPKTYLLSNPGYTEAVTEVGSEIFLFDATQGEERAKKDAAAIAKLFPARHHVTVVVTDLAWPHVAGVRYWVANGATIIAHKAARGFLQSVIDRRWTRAPDLLEQRRKTARLKFVGFDTSYSLAAGAISIHPIDGIGSEVALIGYVVTDHFLWASDYIQTVSEPTLYASEVWRAAKRDGLRPERVAAEHLPLTPWSRIEELQK